MSTTAKTNIEHNRDVEKLQKMIKGIDFCMLTTTCEDGSLVSRPMSVNGDVEADGDLWMFTYGHSHKVEEAKAHSQVNVSFADIKNHNYVSVSGTAELVRDKAKIKELWKPEFKAWFSEGVDTPDIALLKVSAHKAEFWDAPNSLMSNIITLARIATGQPIDMGENKRVELN